MLATSPLTHEPLGCIKNQAIAEYYKKKNFNEQVTLSKYSSYTLCQRQKGILKSKNNFERIFIHSHCIESLFQ
jgi:hypothetical protein